jgi:hypothetical protein
VQSVHRDGGHRKDDKLIKLGIGPFSAVKEVCGCHFPLPFSLFHVFCFFQVLWRPMDPDKTSQDTPRPTWKAIQTHWTNIMKERSVGVARASFCYDFFFLKTTRYIQTFHILFQ